MIRLEITREAQSDIERLRKNHPKVIAKILVKLQEIKNDMTLVDALTEHGYGDREGEEFSVKKWQEQWRAGKNIWRLKLWCLEESGLRYRVIYAYDPDSRSYHVLAIAQRSEIDYDDYSHPLTTRILETYRDL